MGSGPMRAKLLGSFSPISPLALSETFTTFPAAVENKVEIEGDGPDVIDDSGRCTAISRDELPDSLETL